MRPALTKRQASVLSFVKGFIAKHSYPPCMRDVADHFGISVNGAAGNLRLIEKKGYLRRSAGRARSLVVLE